VFIKRNAVEMAIVELLTAIPDPGDEPESTGMARLNGSVTVSNAAL
jgi:hypothetical protein